MAENPDIFNILTPSPILSTLSSYLPISSIVALTRTCRTLSGLYTHLLRHEFDIDARLKRFVRQPKAFRHQLGLAEGLMTGSFALEFFERPRAECRGCVDCVWRDVLVDNSGPRLNETGCGGWEAPNLDVVVQEGSRIDAFCAFLTQREGYQRVGTEDVSEDEEIGWRSMPHGFRYVDKIFIFRRIDQRAGPIVLRSTTIRVYMISLHSFPIKSIVEGAWTTSLINFISWRKAYSVFPWSTFIDRKSYLLENLGRNMELPLQKYRDRDFKFEITSSALQLRRNHPMQKCRKTTDKFSWGIDLDISGMPEIHPDLDPVPEDDVVYIGQVVTELEPSTLQLLGFDAEKENAAEGQSEGAAITKTYHYETKYMRYSGFFT